MRFFVPVLIFLSSFFFIIKTADTQEVVLKIAVPQHQFLFAGDLKSTQDGEVVQIIKRMYQNQPISIEFDFLPWTRAISALQNNSVDATFSTQIAGWHDQQFLKSKSFLNRNVVAITRYDSTRTINSYGDLANYDVATLRGDNLDNELSGRGILFQSIPGSSCVQSMLLHHRLDAVIGFSDSLQQRCKEKLADGSLQLHIIDQHPIFLITNRKNKRAKAIIEQFNSLIAATNY